MARLGPVRLEENWSAMTLSIKTFNKTALSITTLSIPTLGVTKNNMQHSGNEKIYPLC